MLAKGFVLSSIVFAMIQTAPQNPAPAPRPSVPASTTNATTGAPRTSAAQTGGSATTPRPLPPHTTTPAAPATKPAVPATTAANEDDCGGAPCDAPPPKQIVVTAPPAEPQSWTWHDKIAWAVYVILAFLGYAGIMLGLSALKKIERQTYVTEMAAQAAQESAQAALESAKAALLNAQAVIGAERPWLLISVESSPTVEDGFMVMATNRGKSPAQITGTSERIRTVADESKLPVTPEYDNREPAAPMVPIILLPGESTGIKPFSRADAKGMCESDEQFARIENWEEKIYLYGKVIYNDLVATPEKQQHQTDWCCWYIHGRQKSGLVIAGPPGYNLHT